MSNPLSRSRPRAFTLLELILAMVISAALAAALYGTMRAAIQARRAAQQAVEPTRMATITTDILRQDLENVPPPTGLFAGSFIGIHQAGPSGGDNDAVVFYSIGRDDAQNPILATNGPIDRSNSGSGYNGAAGGASASGGRTGLNLNVRGGANSNVTPLAEGIRKVELLVRTDITPPALIRRITRNLLPTTTPPPQEEILCRDVRSFSLRYFDGATWQMEWDSTALGDVLPLAVSLAIELNDPRAGPGQPSARRSERVIPLACGKLADAATTGGL